MRRTRRSLILLAVLALPLSLASSGASAQEPVPGMETCALVSVDEVGEIFGEPLAQLSSGPDMCGWQLGEKVVNIWFVSDGIDDLRTDFNAVEDLDHLMKDLDVAGHRAFFMPGGMVLYVETADGGTLEVSTGGFLEGADLEEAQVALASLVLARSGGDEEEPSPAASSAPGAAASPSPTAG